MAERTVDALANKTAECEALARQLYDVTKARDELLKLVLSGIEHQKEVKQAVLESNEAIFERVQKLGLMIDQLQNRTLALTGLSERFVVNCASNVKALETMKRSGLTLGQQLVVALVVGDLQRVLDEAKQLGFHCPNAKTP